MAEIKKIGSLLFDGWPVKHGTIYNGEQIIFGDTVPGKEVSFVEWKGIYVANRCVCTHVSWEDLDKHGFIFGAPVLIDGDYYLCRSLKVGVGEGVPNEWDAVLDDFGEDIGLWHWNECFFWGQETDLRYETCRAYRGINSARYWYCSIASNRNKYTGFRPVLEPLPPMTRISDVRIGQNIKLYGDGGSVSGRLVELGDYDLELEIGGPLPEKCSWIKREKNIVFVDREAIVYLHEEG